MKINKTEKIHGIIHTSSIAAAGVGAGLAQIPSADTPVLCALQTNMIMAIARQNNISLDEAMSADLLLTFTAAMAGRGLSQWLIGWIPGYGNAINASTAATLTEAIGWAAHAYFLDG